MKLYESLRLTFLDHPVYQKLEILATSLPDKTCKLCEPSPVSAEVVGPVHVAENWTVSYATFGRGNALCEHVHYRYVAIHVSSMWR